MNKAPDMNLQNYLRFYAKLSWHERIFLRLRLGIAPFAEVMEYIPHQGSILDVGCGYGLLSTIMAHEFPDARITGVDIDANRISVARQCAGHRTNLTFKQVDLTQNQPLTDKYGTVICFDIFHHLPVIKQNALLREITRHLTDNGWLIIKDIDTQPRYKYYWNYWHDFMVTQGQRIHCRPHAEWMEMVKDTGFRIQTVTFPSPRSIYPHFLIVARKK
jgi:2-polyprenyl-3-methyl-5-hydroxy-6-metoxy-1,4-benzoquinol methylase